LQHGDSWAGRVPFADPVDQVRAKEEEKQGGDGQADESKLPRGLAAGACHGQVSRGRDDVRPVIESVPPAGWQLAGASNGLQRLGDLR
jgi:hypothetical protein